MAKRKGWPRDTYARAVWDSDLPTLPRIVALAYADHARSGDVAWIALTRLMAVTGIRNKTSVASAVTRLVADDWLELVEKGRQHRASRYRLRTPQGYVSRTAEGESSGTSEQSSGTSPYPSGTSNGPDYSEDHSEDCAALPVVAAIADLDELLRSVGREAS
jgi:hypothetical protein